MLKTSCEAQGFVQVMFKCRNRLWSVVVYFKKFDLKLVFKVVLAIPSFLVYLEADFTSQNYRLIELRVQQSHLQKMDFSEKVQITYEFPKLAPKILCGFWTNLGKFGHSRRNHFSLKIKCKK